MDRAPRDLMRLGAQLLPHVRDVIADVRSLPPDVGWHVELVASGDPDLASLLAEARSVPGDLQLLTWSAYWCAAGFPQVQPTHKLAASMMCTSMTPEAFETLQLPWSSFLVLVPSGLVQVAHPTAGDVDVAYLIVQETDAGPWVTAMALEEPAVWLELPAGPLAGFAEPELPGADEPLALPGQQHFEDLDRRAVHLLGRLLLGVVAELSSQEPSGPPPRSRRGPPSRRNREQPKAWTFVLNREVRVDCRDEIREWLAGRRGGPPTVRILVRGHWRRQPHGPGLSLRKLIHIEPYCRGPEDGPLRGSRS